MNLRSYNRANLLTTKNPAYLSDLLRFTRDELIRDLGDAGDITTDAVVPKNKTVEMCILSKGSGVFAGEKEIKHFLMAKNNSIRAGMRAFKLTFLKHDGDSIKKNDVLLIIKGELRNILKVERVVLNLLGRMCGIATFTNRMILRINSVNNKCSLAATRKTLHGLLDKRAVSIGGGLTHRLGLYDALLIKDNHLDYLGRDLALAIECIKRKKNKAAFLEIEVESFREAVKAARLLNDKPLVKNIPYILLLDNQSPSEIKKIVHTLKKNNLRKNIGLEASGGISESNIMAYAKTGVDIISSGALTHSAPWFNLTLQPYEGEYEKPPVRLLRQRKI